MSTCRIKIVSLRTSTASVQVLTCRSLEVKHPVFLNAQGLCVGGCAIEHNKLYSMLKLSTTCEGYGVRCGVHKGDRSARGPTSSAYRSPMLVPCDTDTAVTVFKNELTWCSRWPTGQHFITSRNGKGIAFRNSTCWSTINPCDGVLHHENSSMGPWASGEREAGLQ